MGFLSKIVKSYLNWILWVVNGFCVKSPKLTRGLINPKKHVSLIIIPHNKFSLKLNIFLVFT